MNCFLESELGLICRNFHLTPLNTGTIPAIVTDSFKLHYPGFQFGGLKKNLMNCILSQLEIEGFTLLVSRKWRLGRILFLELKGHLWPRNVKLDERHFSVLSYLIYPRNEEPYQRSATSADLFPPKITHINYISRILDFSGVYFGLVWPM